MKKRILILLILASTSLTAYADAKLSQVEVIVFQNHASRSQLGDIKTTNNTIPKLSGSEIPGPASVPNPNNRLVAKNQLLLLNEHQHLQQSQHYNVLLHLGWTQVITNESTTIPVHLYAKEPQSTLEIGELGGYSNDTPMLLEGTVAVSQAKKIRTKVDFVLNTGDATVRLHQQAFLSLGELYYFDHPNYGIIVRITPTSL